MTGAQYEDKDTQEVFSSAKDLVNFYISKFSKEVSKAAGVDVKFDALDDDGHTSVSRGSATIGINVIEEQGILLFLARIMKVPPENQLSLFQELLELNYLATGDSSFALEKATNTLCLRAHRSIQGLDYSEFEDLLHTVASVADEWDDKLIEQYS